MNVLNMFWKINNDTAKITKIKIINLEKSFGQQTLITFVVSWESCSSAQISYGHEYINK